MILLEADIGGFGCLVKQRFTFGEGLTIIHGPNESGKTTLTECIVRLLFGYPEHQYMAALKARKPWHSHAYKAALIYRLDDGRVLETQRDFSQDNVPTETVERPLMRRVPELSGTKRASPGWELLHLSLETFEAAAVMRAGEFTGRADGKSYQLLAERIAELVGAAGEAGAQDAVDRLDDFVKELGTDRATKRPLSVAHAQTDAARAALEAYRRDGARMHENIAQRATLLERQAALSEECSALDVQLQGARLSELRARIAAAELAQSRLKDVPAPAASSPEVLEGAKKGIETAIDAWVAARSAETDASTSSQSKEDQRTELLRQIGECDAKIKEADATIASRSDAIERLKPEAARKPLSDDAVEHLEQLSELADIQEHAARTKETQAAINRQRPRAGVWPAVSVFIVAMVLLLAGAILHLPPVILSAVAGVLISGTMFAYFFVVERGRSAANAALESEAQAARTVAASAAANLSKEIGALGLSDIRAVRRAVKVQAEIQRFSEALEAARRSAAQNHELRDSLEARFNDFDRLDRQLVDARARTEARAADLRRLLDDAGVPGGDLEPRIQAFREARLGVEEALVADKAASDARAALAGALAGETLDEMRASAERLAKIAGDAFAPADADPREIEERLKRKNDERPGVAGELARVNEALAQFDTQYPGGGAPLEEQLAACELEEARLLRARDAAALARDVIDKTKDDVHKNFAPHLNALAGPALREITHDRYKKVIIDPRDFSLQVSADDGAGIVGPDALSAGTQEQLHLSLRAATAQALGAGGSDERVPLLLDDALAHADERRLAAAVRHLASIAHRQQILLFTQRDAVLDAARRLQGVVVVHLSGPSPAAPA
ncbi:MAG: AAA family ATPase [Candidatus Eremiobacteraeota bacterium]|nr:AAA family ATPase [Candidatus Eremiobacteraeota bacterium]